MSIASALLGWGVLVLRELVRELESDGDADQHADTGLLVDEGPHRLESARRG
jgi:hypothetical protein